MSKKRDDETKRTGDEEASPAKQNPDRDAILRRRAMFVASAVAGLSLTHCEQPTPQPCLNVVMPPPDGGPDPDASGTAAPSASGPASGSNAPGQGGAPGEGEGGEGGEGELPPPHPCLRVKPPEPPTSGSSPQPCLSPPMPPPPPTAPTPCLKIAPPDDTDGT